MNDRYMGSHIYVYIYIYVYIPKSFVMVRLRDWSSWLKAAMRVDDGYSRNHENQSRNSKRGNDFFRVQLSNNQQPQPPLQPPPPLPFHQDLLNLHHIYFRHGSKRDWRCSPRFFVGKKWNSRNTSANWTKIRMASCDLDALGYVTVTRPRHVSRKSGISSGRENGDFMLLMVQKSHSHLAWPGM